MKERIIQLDYCDSNSLIIVNKTGKIELLEIPFLVICVRAVGKISFQMIVHVEQVFATGSAKIIYQIQGEHFYHFYFNICD